MLEDQHGAGMGSTGIEQGIQASGWEQAAAKFPVCVAAVMRC
jgi:hypothetical protein